MHGSYINLAAAIQSLAYAHGKSARTRNHYENACHDPDPDTRRYYSREVLRDDAFCAGVSFAIAMMLDTETAAIIEEAAKERAPEDRS